MKTKNNNSLRTNKSDDFMPQIYYSNDKLLKSVLERKLGALQFIIDMVPDSSSRISPFIDRDNGTIDWQAISLQAIDDDELCLIQWMKTIWTEKMHVEARRHSGIWPNTFDYREGILRAIAEDSFTSYLMTPIYRKQPSSGQETSLECQLGKEA